LAGYESLIEGFKIYNATVSNYVITAFPDITRLEYLSNYINYQANHVDIMMPYPNLADKERREITNYYTFHFIRTNANLQKIDQLINSDNHLFNMIEKEIGNH
jgi:hypothetical protein